MTDNGLAKTVIVAKAGVEFALPKDLRVRVAKAGEDSVCAVPVKVGTHFAILTHKELSGILAALRREFPGPLGKRAALLFAASAVEVGVRRSGQIRVPRAVKIRTGRDC